MPGNNLTADHSGDPSWLFLHAGECLYPAQRILCGGYGKGIMQQQQFYEFAAWIMNVIAIACGSNTIQPNLTG